MAFSFLNSHFCGVCKGTDMYAWVQPAVCVFLLSLFRISSIRWPSSIDSLFTSIIIIHNNFLSCITEKTWFYLSPPNKDPGRMEGAKSGTRRGQQLLPHSCPVHPSVIFWCTGRIAGADSAPSPLPRNQTINGLFQKPLQCGLLTF